ncbi:hypothetical protein ACIOWI_07775 [Streptomyces sp. NPDC087659]|uniref:hypothetical protein n=1 Tax=Streptomyces sp. NPDC087659 TaxID=3365801 RepID=UPI00380E2B6D
MTLDLQGHTRGVDDDGVGAVVSDELRVLGVRRAVVGLRRRRLPVRVRLRLPVRARVRRGAPYPPGGVGGGP